MANQPHRTTKKEKAIEDKINIDQNYDSDTFIGDEWKKVLPDILNKRHAEGWAYLPPYYRIGVDDSKADCPVIYSVLYKKINIITTSNLNVNPEIPIKRPTSNNSFSLEE